MSTQPIQPPTHDELEIAAAALKPLNKTQLRATIAVITYEALADLLRDL